MINLEAYGFPGRAVHRGTVQRLRRARLCLAADLRPRRDQRRARRRRSTRSGRYGVRTARDLVVLVDGQPLSGSGGGGSRVDMRARSTTRRTRSSSRRRISRAPASSPASTCCARRCSCRPSAAHHRGRERFEKTELQLARAIGLPVGSRHADRQDSLRTAADVRRSRGLAARVRVARRLPRGEEPRRRGPGQRAAPQRRAACRRCTSTRTTARSARPSSARTAPTRWPPTVRVPISTAGGRRRGGSKRRRGAAPARGRARGFRKGASNSTSARRCSICAPRSAAAGGADQRAAGRRRADAGAGPLRRRRRQQPRSHAGAGGGRRRVGEPTSPRSTATTWPRHRSRARSASPSRRVDRITSEDSSNAESGQSIGPHGGAGCVAPGRRRGLLARRSRGRESTDDAQVDGHITQIALAGRRDGHQGKRSKKTQPSRPATVLVQIDPRDYQVAVERARRSSPTRRPMRRGARPACRSPRSKREAGVRNASGGEEQAEAASPEPHRSNAARANLVAAQARQARKGSDCGEDGARRRDGFRGARREGRESRSSSSTPRWPPPTRRAQPPTRPGLTCRGPGGDRGRGTARRARRGAPQAQAAPGWRRRPGRSSCG